MGDGHVVGSMSYRVTNNRIGIPWVSSPHWSHLGGPVLREALRDEEKTRVYGQIIAKLMEQAPRDSSFRFVCSPHANDREFIKHAFINAEFEHTSELTYSVSPNDPDIIGKLSSRCRTQINSAKRTLEITDKIDASQFIEFYKENLKAAGTVSYSPLDIACNLIKRGMERGQVRIIAARKKEKQFLYDAAIAYALDTTIPQDFVDKQRRAYLCWKTRRRVFPEDSPADKPHQGATKLLTLEAARDVGSLGLIFDADGAHSQGGQFHFRDTLKFPTEELRDVFIRQTPLARLYDRVRPGIKRAATLFGFG